MSDLINRQKVIDTEGLDEQIRCEMCRNPMHTDRGCDGNCKYDEKLYERIIQILGERIKPSPFADVPDINVGDTISRHGILHAFEEMCSCTDYGWDERDFRDLIKKMPSAESETNKQELIRTMNAGIIATSTEDVYSCGMRNGIRWCRALLEDDTPKFEDASQYAEPERPKGEWISHKSIFGGPEEKVYTCNQCGYNIGFHTENFCPNCGAIMVQEVEE